MKVCDTMREAVTSRKLCFTMVWIGLMLVAIVVIINLLTMRSTCWRRSSLKTAFG